MFRFQHNLIGPLSYMQFVVDQNRIMQQDRMCIMKNTGQEKKVETLIFSSINGVVRDDPSPPSLSVNILCLHIE